MSKLPRLERLIVLERSPAHGDERSFEHERLRSWWQALPQAERDAILKMRRDAERHGRRRA